MNPVISTLIVGVLACNVLLFGQEKAKDKKSAPAAQKTPAATAPKPTLEKAKELFNKKLYDQAKTFLQGVIQAAPKNPGAYELLAKTYAAQKDEQNEIKTLEKFVALKPKDRPSLDRLLQYYEAKQKKDKLYAILGKLVKVAPKNENYHFKKAVLDFEKKNFSAALAGFETVRSISPVHKNLPYYIGDSAFFLKKYGAAAPALKKASIAPDAKKEVFLHLAETYLALKNSNDAAQAYEALLRKDPDNVQAISALIPMYEKQNNRVRLVRLYEKQQALTGKKDPKALLKMANIYRGQNASKAISLYEEVLAAEGKNVKALTALVALYTAKNDLPKTRDYLARLTALKPTAKGNKQLANIYLQLKDSTKAIKPLEAYTAEKKGDDKSIFTLAELYLRAKQDEKAASTFKLLAEKKTGLKGVKKGVLFHRYGIALSQIGKKAEAVKAYEVAVRLNPMLGEAWYHNAGFYLANEKWNEAINALLKVKALNIHRTEVVRGLAKAYWEGRF